MLDTNTIISGLKDKLPGPIRAVVAQSASVASAVVIGEMVQGLFSLKPADARSAGNRRIIERTIAELEKSPILTPNDSEWRLAMACLAVLGRCNDLDRSTRAHWLRDALIYVSARSAGVTLVTSNLREFDLFQQLLPGGEVLFFTPVSG